MNKKKFKEAREALIFTITAIIFILFLSFFIPLSKQNINFDNYISTKIYDRNGILLRDIISTKFGTAKWIEFEDIPEFAINAFITAEDKRFYFHHGIDLLAILRSIKSYMKQKRITSGGSTISQQLIKSVSTYNRNIFNKMYEIWLAIRIENTFKKSEIITYYLNRIPFGNQLFGLAAASNTYFLKEVHNLTIAEVAFLAVIPKSPSLLNPYHNSEKIATRQQKILKKLLKNKFLTDEKYERAKNQKIKIISKEINFKAPHFCNQIIHKYLTTINRPDIIYTTIDWQLQTKIRMFLTGRLNELNKYNAHNASILTVDNKTKEILVWIGSHDYFDDVYNGQVDGIIALRQPGSALKPFTYGVALENGMTASSILPDVELNTYEKSGYYTPQNYDRQFHGPVSIRQALSCSYNVPPIRILDKFGEVTLLEILKKVGFNSLTKSPSFYGKGLTLGNGEVSLLELVRAYSTISAGGKIRNEKYITRLHYANNQIVDFTSKNDSSGIIFNDEINAILIDILSDNDARIPAFGKFNPLQFPFDCAVKTGTSKDYRDNWAIACTPELTVGVWVGNFNGEPMHNVSGISGAGPILNDIMHFLDKYYNFKPFKLSNTLKKARICPLSGKLPGVFCTELKEEIFIDGTIPVDTCKWHVKVKVDVRDGKLATRNSKNEFIKEIAFLDLPEVYHAWMIENNLTVPPKDSSCIDILDSNNSQIHIISPKNGDIFKIDPILRREYQQVKLEAEVPLAFNNILWLVDGKNYQSVEWPYCVTWQLEKGVHEFQIKAHEIMSNTVTITVLE